MVASLGPTRVSVSNEGSLGYLWSIAWIWSSRVECDIGAFKDVIPPKRAILEPAAVEMHIVVGRNKDLTELDPRKIEAVPHTTWERLYPTRPMSPVGYEDGDLEQAEAFDDHIDLVLSYGFDPN
jgi:hypothetical protein